MSDEVKGWCGERALQPFFQSYLRCETCQTLVYGESSAAVPLGAAGHCLDLLEPDGVLVIRTPSYPQGETGERLVEIASPFLQQLKEREHRYVFSKSSIVRLFHELGAADVVFESGQEIYSQHDMYLVVGKTPPRVTNPEAVIAALEESASGRMVGALLDVVGPSHPLGADAAELQAETGEVAAAAEQPVGARQFADRESSLLQEHRVSPGSLRDEVEQPVRRAVARDEEHFSRALRRRRASRR